MTGPRWRRYLRFWRTDVKADLDEELAFHLEEKVDDLIARGMHPSIARQEALRLFGDVRSVRQECLTEARHRETEMRRIETLDVLRKDATFALRTMRARPTFAAAIALTLALGIGATTAIFSVVNTVLLRPLPFQDAERIVMLVETWREFGRGAVSPGHYTDWSQQARSFEVLAIWQPNTMNLTDGDPQRIRGAHVTAGFFRIFQIPPALGRYLLDDEGSDSRVVVLSHPLWTTRFESDSAIVGKQITISGVRHTVVGVAPAAATMTIYDDRLWLPFTLPPGAQTNYGSHMLRIFGKLKAGVSVQAARTEIAGITEQIRKKAPNDMHDRGANVLSYRGVLVESYETQLWVLLAAVTFVLLIACGNVASLLLARATSRRKEIAIRGALGGSRARLVRQLLTESMVLALAGGALGILVARIGIRFLVGMGPDSVPRLADASLSWDVLAFAAGATLLCGLIFGLAPALRATRIDLQSDLRDGGRGSRGVIKDRVRGALIVAEMAVALLLLVSAGLLIRSAWLLQRVQPGFDPSGVTMMRVALPAARYDSAAAVVNGFSRIVERVRGTPGVQRAAAGSRVPMWGGSIDMGIRIDGKPWDPNAGLIGHVRLVTDGYFETIGIPITRGRSLQPDDMRAGAPSVIVVNETFAKRTFGGENPIGHRVSGWTRDTIPEWREIVGVVADVRAFGRDQEIPPEIYMPMSKAPHDAWPSFNRTMTIVAKSPHGAPLATAMRAALRGVDAELPAYDVQTMTDVLAQSTETRRFNTMLLTLLGMTGLLLAAVGIYGVIAFFVTQRTHEIGVRIALGASATNVVGLVVRQALWLAMFGVLVGGVAAWWATSTLQSMLFDIEARDPVAFAGAAVVLVLVSVGAAMLPARRAARLPPATALAESA